MRRTEALGRPMARYRGAEASRQAPRKSLMLPMLPMPPMKATVWAPRQSRNAKACPIVLRTRPGWRKAACRNACPKRGNRDAAYRIERPIPVRASRCSTARRTMSPTLCRGACRAASAATAFPRRRRCRCRTLIEHQAANRSALHRRRDSPLSAQARRTKRIRARSIKPLSFS
jgi:hypothetical protein